MSSYASQDLDDVFDMNLRGVAYGIQAVYPLMVRQRAGHIINTASVAGLLPAPGQGSYTTSKHAVVGLSKALRIEAKVHRVRVSALCPGVIRTPILTGGKYGRTNIKGLSEQRIAELWEKFRPMDADVFAGKVIRAVARNEAMIIVPGWWKAFWYLERFSPSLSARLWETAVVRLRAAFEASAVRSSRRPDDERSSSARVSDARFN